MFWGLGGLLGIRETREVVDVQYTHLICYFGFILCLQVDMHDEKWLRLWKTFLGTVVSLR